MGQIYYYSPKIITIANFYRSFKAIVKKFKYALIKNLSKFSKMNDLTIKDNATTNNSKNGSLIYFEDDNELNVTDVDNTHRM